MKDAAAGDVYKADVAAQSCTILIDDDETLLKAISLELRDKGYECVTENNGNAALRLLREKNFDVALIDLEMPGIDGFQILDFIQKNRPNIIPIILTGRGDVGRAVKAIKMGAFDFLEKPCNPHLLENAIRRAQEFRHAQARITQMERVAGETQSALERERAFNQAQKLESVGRLAAGIAHEINTPTQYVGDNIEFLHIAYQRLGPMLATFRQLLDSATDNAALPALLNRAREETREVNLDYMMNQIPRAIEQSLEGIERIASLVQAMKEFSHPGVAEKTNVDLNQCIRSTVTVSRNEWKYVADLEMDLDKGLPCVYCLPGELNQVFLNMIVNAAHSIGDVVGSSAETKGKIVVSTREVGGWVEVRISDSGAGIPKEIRDRVFEPFFTTKEVGRGTGQGLAIARNVIVEKHGGSISFESKVGVGTTFVIRLPIDAEH